MRSVKLNNNFIKRFINGFEGGSKTVYGVPVNSEFVNVYENVANLNEYRSVDDFSAVDYDTFHVKRGSWGSFDGFVGKGVVSASGVTYKYTKVDDYSEVSQPMFVTKDNYDNFKEYYYKDIQYNLENISSYLDNGGFYWVRGIEELKWCANRVNGEDGASYNNKIVIVLGDNIGGVGTTKNCGQTKVAFDYYNDKYNEGSLQYPHEIVDFKIGSSLEIPFEGIFDGNFFKIGNITIYADGDYNGLFGVLGCNGVIRNLVLGEISLVQRNKLNLSHISKYGTDIVVGALCGKNMGIIENVSYDKENGEDGSMVTIEGFYPEVYAVENKSDDNIIIDDLNLQSKRLLYMDSARGICSVNVPLAKISINHSDIYNTETSGIDGRISSFDEDVYVGTEQKAQRYITDYATSGTYDYCFDLADYINGNKWTSDVARKQCTSGYIPLTPFLDEYVDSDANDIDAVLHRITSISDGGSRPSESKIGRYLVGNFSTFTSAHNSDIKPLMDEISANTETSAYVVSPSVDSILSVQYYDVEGIQQIICTEPSNVDLSEVCRSTYGRFIENGTDEVKEQFGLYLERLKNAKVVEPAMFPTDNRTDSIALHNLVTSADNQHDIKNWNMYVPTEGEDTMWECSVPRSAEDSVYDYTYLSYNNNGKIPYEKNDVIVEDNGDVYMYGQSWNDGNDNSVSGCKGFIYYDKESVDYEHSSLSSKIGDDLDDGEVNSVMMLCADSVELNSTNTYTEYNKNISNDSKYMVPSEWGDTASEITEYGRHHRIYFKRGSFYYLNPDKPLAQLVLPNSQGSITCLPSRARLAVVMPNDITFVRYRKTNGHGVVQTYYVPLNHRMYFIKIDDSKSSILNPLSKFSRNRPNYRKALDTNHKNYNYLNGYCINNPVNYSPYCGYFAQGPVYSTRLGGDGKYENAVGSQFILMPMFLRTLYHNNIYQTYDAEHNTMLYQQDFTPWGDTIGQYTYYGKWSKYKIDYRKDVYGFSSKDDTLGNNVYDLRADFSIAPSKVKNDEHYKKYYGSWANELSNPSRISIFHLPWYGIDTNVKQIGFSSNADYAEYTNGYNGVTQQYTYSGSLYARMFITNINLYMGQADDCNVIREDCDDFTSDKTNSSSGFHGGIPYNFLPYAKRNRSIPLGNDGRQAYYVSPFVGLNCGTIRNVYVNVTTLVEKPFVGFCGTICACMDRGVLDNFYARNNVKYRDSKCGNFVIPENDKYYVIHDENNKVSFLDTLYNDLSRNLRTSSSAVDRYVLYSIFNLGTVARLQVSRGVRISNGYMNVECSAFKYSVKSYDMYDYVKSIESSQICNVEYDVFSRYSPFIAVCDLNKSRYGQLYGGYYTRDVAEHDKMMFTNLYIDYGTNISVDWQSSYIAEQRTTNDIPSIVQGYIFDKGMSPELGSIEGRDYCRVGWWQNDYPMCGNAIYNTGSSLNYEWTMSSGVCGVNRYIKTDCVYSVKGGKKRTTSTDYNESNQYYYSMGYISGNSRGFDLNTNGGNFTGDALNYYYFSSPYGSFVAFDDKLKSPDIDTDDTDNSYVINPRLVVFVMKRPYTDSGFGYAETESSDVDYTSPISEDDIESFSKSKSDELYGAIIEKYGKHDRSDRYYYYTYTKEVGSVKSYIVMTMASMCVDGEMSFGIKCDDGYFLGKESADNIVYNNNTISWGYSLSPMAIRTEINNDGYAMATGIVTDDFRGILLVDQKYQIVGFIDNGNAITLDGGAYTLRFETYKDNEYAKFVKVGF